MDTGNGSRAVIEGDGFSAFISKPKNDDGAVEGRIRSILTLRTFRQNVEECRPTSPSTNLITNITSLKSTYLLGEVRIIFFETREAHRHCDSINEKNLVPFCQFWDEEGRVWSSEGCRLENDQVFTMANSTLFICDHLTEFAVLQRQLDCKSERLVQESYLAQVCIYGVLAFIILLLYRRMITKTSRTTPAIRKGQYHKLPLFFNIFSP